MEDLPEVIYPIRRIAQFKISSLFPVPHAASRTASLVLVYGHKAIVLTDVSNYSNNFELFRYNEDVPDE